MMIVSDSFGDSSPQTYLAVRSNRAVTAHAAEAAASSMREREVFLRETGRVHNHNL